MKAFYPVVCFALLATVIWLKLQSCRNEPKTVGNIKVLEAIKNDTVHHYNDAQGTEHGTKQVAIGSTAELQLVYSELDSVKTRLRIRDKQIEYLTAVGSTTKGTITPEVQTITIHDKPATTFTYSDRWLKLHGILSDTPVIDYSTYDSLIVTSYHKRKWILGKKETFIDAYSLNPASHISGLTGIKVASEKPKRWGIGPFAGYGFNGVGWGPSMGISIQYSLFRF